MTTPRVPVFSYRLSLPNPTAYNECARAPSPLVSKTWQHNLCQLWTVCATVASAYARTSYTENALSTSLFITYYTSCEVVTWGVGVECAACAMTRPLWRNNHITLYWHSHRLIHCPSQLHSTSPYVIHCCADCQISGTGLRLRLEDRTYFRFQFSFAFCPRSGVWISTVVDMVRGVMSMCISNESRPTFWTAES